jgi:hypothetical protein
MCEVINFGNILLQQAVYEYYQNVCLGHVIQGVTKRTLQLGMLIYIYSEDTYTVFRTVIIYEITPSFTSNSYDSM